MKVCKSCFEVLPFTEFYKSAKNKGGLRVVCKECFRAAEKEKRDNLSEEAKEELKEQIKEWKEENPEAVRAHQIRWKTKNKS